MEQVFQFIDHIGQPVLVLYEKNFYFANRQLLFELGFETGRKPVSLIQIISAKNIELLQNLAVDQKTDVDLRTRYSGREQFIATRFNLDFDDNHLHCYFLKNKANIQHKQRVYQTLIQNMPAPVLMLSEDLRLIFVNRSFRSLAIPQPLKLNHDLGITDVLYSEGDLREIIRGAQNHDVVSAPVTTLHNKKYIMQATWFEESAMYLSGIYPTHAANNNTLNGSSDDLFVRHSVKNLHRWLGIAEEQLMVLPQLHGVGLIRQQIGRMKFLLSQISRHTEKQGKTKSRAISLNMLIKNQIEILKANDDFQKKVSLNLDLSDDTREVFANYNDLSRTFVHIMHNAVEAKGDLPRINITVSTTNETDGVALKIRDNGYGIDNEQMQKIFDPFYTTKADALQSRNGRVHLGLGLYWVKTTLKNMRGRCRIESKPEQGTTVTLFLPTRE